MERSARLKPMKKDKTDEDRIEFKKTKLRTTAQLG